MKQVKDIHFIHANGFYPDAYSPLLNNLNSNFNINKFLIKPVNENKNNFTISYLCIDKLFVC